MLISAPPLIQVHHFCRLDNSPEPTPLVTPPQSSDDEEVMTGIKCASSRGFKAGLFIFDVCVVYISRMYVHTYRQLPARLGRLAQLGSAHRRQGNYPYSPRSRLLGNCPTIPPFQPLRALPPSPAVCLPTWTLSMLSHGPPLTWVENNKENYIKQLVDSLQSLWGN